MATAKLIKKIKNTEYPPRVFNCRLKELLEREFGPEYDLNKIAAFVSITPITLKSILAGGTVKLENALKLAELVNSSVVEIWSLR